MVPNVSQQLAAVRHTLAKAVVPALDPDNGFAQEQAGLALASLDWALDVLESELPYLQLEYAEYHRLLAALAALPSGTNGVLPPSDPPGEPAALREATVDLKRRSEAAFEAIASGGEAGAAAEARRLLGAVAERQNVRERAWARMTGFPGASDSIADVLRAQTAA